MWKTVVRAVVALALLAGVAVASDPLKAGAQDLVPAVVDVSSTIESLPGTVSPAGTGVLYRATLQNHSVLATTATLKVTTPPEFTHDLALTPLPSGCSAAANVVNCSRSLGAGGTFVLELAEVTAVFANGERNYTATSEAISQDPLELLEYTPNNNDTVNTKVLAANGNLLSGVLKRGTTKSINVGDGRMLSITGPAGPEAIIIDVIRPLSPQAFQRCGSPTTMCGNGFLIRYVDHPTFRTLNVNDPIVQTLTFGIGDPCFGLGGPCTGITWAEEELAPLLQHMDYCPGAGPGGNRGDGTANGTGNKCINHKFLKNKQTWFETRSLSEDPPTLPPLNLGK